MLRETVITQYAKCKGSLRVVLISPSKWICQKQSSSCQMSFGNFLFAKVCSTLNFVFFQYGYCDWILSTRNGAQNK
jgi:hypothetical protein